MTQTPHAAAAAASAAPSEDGGRAAATGGALFFQTGDFAEAWRRRLAGGAETYGGQDFSLGVVERLAQARPVTILSWSPRAHDEVIAPNLRSIGISGKDANDPAAVARILDAVAPALLIARSPIPGPLRWAAARGVPVLPIFADIFQPGGSLKRRWQNRRLARLLSGPNVPCVCNHSLNATRSIAAALGLPKTRLVPWDWPPLDANPDPKPAPDTDPARPFTLFFAGAIIAGKGVADCIAAAAAAKAAGRDLRFSFAGSGEIEAMEAEAARLGVADRVAFLGPVANTEVRGRMAEHDAVVVPSRHTYQEGLPKTLLEGLASRSPVIYSDHPSYASRLRDGEGGLQFTAADPAALAAACERLRADPGLYARLSAAAPETLAGLYIGIPWNEAIESFIADPADSAGWAARRSLAALEAAGA
ncbi:glycosyltransferase family 4 protein [Rhodovulum sp. DZ06]|uniref:glycosyltransferase family 4 protein n=1 Tax=Rhodovulum sp. DZ06 TaxID=3425126 RepID=UPI003D342990